MTPKLNRLPNFSGPAGPLLLVIMDGVGVAPPVESNAVHVARTPNLDRFMKLDLYAEICAHGPAVGLPTVDDMGNSEVGHNALGAGRIIDQGAKLVNKAIASGELFETDLWADIARRGNDGKTLHLIGLLSDGNVHSHIDHLFAMIERAAADGVKRLRVHALLDGRDVDARSALRYLEPTEKLLAGIGADKGFDYRIASGGGRMRVTMDRYEADWDIVKRGWDAHVHGIGRPFGSATEAVRTLYDEDEKATDQYLGSFIVADDEGAPVGRIEDGDAVIFFNFRGDRAIEISRAFGEADFDAFDRGKVPDVLYAGMLEYDGDLHVPSKYLLAPPVIERTMGEYLCAAGVTSFACSETQKFGHVTYFWNGNRSGYIDEKIEKYVCIPSDKIDFDQVPAMKAREITRTTIGLLRSGDYRWGRINLANGDMVGHTGVFKAAVEAMEVVDECLGKLEAVIRELGGIMIVTADHGNADIMFTEAEDGTRAAKTSHTLSPVPFAVFDPVGGRSTRMSGVPSPGLANVASTTLNLLGYEAPEDYEPSLLKIAGSVE